MAGGSGRGHDHPIPPNPPHQRHCWVDLPDQNPHPGLAIDWRPDSDGVMQVLVTWFDEQARTLTQQWLPAELVSRIGR